MKSTKFIGVFKSNEGNVYELNVTCFSFFQAFFLLTADAIRSGKHYQLYSITDDKGVEKKIDDILKCSKVFI
jgi:hypothetical protein